MINTVVTVIAVLLLLGIAHVWLTIWLIPTARKTGTGSRWMALFPGLNLFVLSRVGGFPAWTSSLTA